VYLIILLESGICGWTAWTR